MSHTTKSSQDVISGRVARFPQKLPSLQKPKGPEWLDDALFYEIYPQSFYDSNGDGIGDLPGIIEKLVYVRDLGVNAIWLNPFYESPFRDAGYDVSDHCRVAARYGTNQDAENLFRAAKDLGLHVIIDLVPGHTSIDHPWFKASCSPKENSFSNWFVWTSSTWVAGGDKFIQGYCERNGNFLSNYFWHQPALNYGYGKPEEEWQLPYDHPDTLAVRGALKDIMRFWLDRGASGFRVDMAGSLIKNDPDGKIKLLWQDVREMLDRDYPHAFMISEWSEPRLAIPAGFHADFYHWFKSYNSLWSDKDSFFHSEGRGDIMAFLKDYVPQYEGTYGQGYIALPVGNHDLRRINAHRSQRQLELIYVFQFTMPNLPFLYYGDEIGMRHIENIPSIEGSYGRSARSPMQWNGGPNKGFSTASPQDLYFPVDADDDAPTVDAQLGRDGSLLEFVKSLIRLRKEEAPLKPYAPFQVIFAQPNTYPFVFERSSGEEKLLVALNPSRRSAEAIVSGKLTDKLQLVFGQEIAIESHGDEIIFRMPGESYAVYKSKV